MNSLTLTPPPHSLQGQEQPKPDKAILKPHLIKNLPVSSLHSQRERRNFTDSLSLQLSLNDCHNYVLTTYSTAYSCNKHFDINYLTEILLQF